MTRKIRLLISDDNRDFVRILVGYFSKQPNIEIVGIAYDGDQTLEMIEQTKPDALLLDLIMPNVSGFEVLPLKGFRLTYM